MTHVDPTASRSWWSKVLTLEPAVVHGVIGALVFILALWGVDVAGFGDRLDQTILTALGIIPLVTAWWTRGKVTPDAKVLEAVKQDSDGVYVVVAGPAADQAHPGATVREYGLLADGDDFQIG